jgi:ABC-type sugar transport system permease subunit
VQTVRAVPTEQARRVSRHRGGRGIQARREERLAWAMLAPTLVALLVLSLYPALATIVYSFQHGGSFGIGMTGFVLSNYQRLLHDVQFWSAFKFSILFSVITVAGQMVFGVALALFANREFRGRWLVRAAILFPWAIPTATNSVVWAYMFNDQYGLVNGVDVREAEKVDGATRWQGFWYVTLPLLRPTLAVTLILRTIQSLQAFDLISAFTNGAPGISTQNLGLYIYAQIQQFGDFGYGSTIAVVVMVVTLAFIALYLRAL